MLRRQTSKVDGSVFERVPDDVGRLRHGEVWAKVNGGGGSERGRGEDGIGADGGGGMFSLP